VAIDYARAMAAFKVGAEEGDAGCQYLVSTMYKDGEGVDVDYKQARTWLEKAVAQDYPSALGNLGNMYFEGWGVTPSWRRAREYFERAVVLGSSVSLESIQDLAKDIQNVTGRRSIHYSGPSITRARPHAPPLHAQVAPLMDKRVEIHDTSRADMKGKSGVATDFHPMGGRNKPTTWRYTVKLDYGEAFKVKLASVRAEGVGGEGGRGGKGTAAGAKKGRAQGGRS